ncbi:MAG: hypothetical protein JXP73_16840 [Deltaproteobacteria bacterium]|nr:hypothetical protein [Deltaproteobacteria bacterium]
MFANACECEIQIEHNGQLRKEKVRASSNTVDAAKLRQQMLHFFKVGSPIDDLEVESDEDESWTLLGFDGNGGSVELDGAKVIELKDYSTFRLTPRTAGGSPEVR